MSEQGPQNSANAYLMTMLLQRLDTLNPGLIKEMAAGVEADQRATVESGKSTPEIAEIFKNASTILARASR
ncbi:MAG: hypothetical protein AAGC96_06365 [Pseudomonadota bacterium]